MAANEILKRLFGDSRMQQLICRDCGLTLPSGVRGCPRCALNLEIERKIDRIVWRVVFPGLIISLLLVAATLVYFLR